MVQLTDPAYLGHPPADEVAWLSPEGRPPVPVAALTLGPFDGAAQAAAQAWLDTGPWDDDATLEMRTDNHGDELGRTAAALRERLALAERPPSPSWAGGRRVLVDARSLQASAFGTRGIGRFARAALMGLRDAVGDDRITLLVDRGLADLPDELVGSCATVTRVTERTLPTFSVLVQPSPMTASADPLLPLLHSTARRIAIVFDVIPLHYPTVYLRHPAARAEYAAALDALRLYDDFVCISHLTRQHLAEVLDRPLEGPDALSAVVAWPRDVLPAGAPRAGAGTGPIVVMTGDEPRKNTFGALAGVGAATADRPGRDVVVIGMAGQDTRVHHWSIAAAIRPGETRTLGRVSDAEMEGILAEAAAVVVASFDEGLSLPVIEAVRAGAPVVASDIPAHRELIGRGAFLADPADPASIARAVRRVAGRGSVHARQSRALARHQHEDLETTVGLLARMYARPAEVALPPAAVHAPGRTLRVGFATPWVPQRTGVADFSTTTTIELARLCDVTAYVTSSARVADTLPPGVRLPDRPIGEARPGVEDVFVSVVGNSHYHLPFLEVVDRIESVVVSHDTRLVELYLALRGAGGVQQLMTRSGRPLHPPLDDQIADMRLLQDAGFWEVARRAGMLVLHSPSAAPRIEEETGVPVHVLPFANQRVPRTDAVTPQMRAGARQRLGLAPGRIHLASFGYVDLRTKMTDVVVESAAWLAQWGHPVTLHLVGAAHPSVAEDLARRARAAGLDGLAITGFVDDEVFRDYLLAVDLGVQLRVGPLLGVSGPLSDLAAFGTSAVASRGLAVDVAAPDYVHRLPDEVSPVMVAEAVEQALAARRAAPDVEAQRRAYLERQSPRRYAELLLDLLHRAAS
jgi:glycosyltransferase involved in cell wall biosynthesis